LYSRLCWCRSPTASLLNLNVHTVYPCAATGSFLQLCMQLPPDPALASVIEATSLPLLYVGFGSMERFMFDTNWEEVFEVLESGVQM